MKKLGEHAKKQVECELNGTKIINKEEISNFINELKYPLNQLFFHLTLINLHLNLHTY